MKIIGLLVILEQSASDNKLLARRASRPEVMDYNSVFGAPNETRSSATKLFPIACDRSAYENFRITVSCFKFTLLGSRREWQVNHTETVRAKVGAQNRSFDIIPASQSGCMRGTSHRRVR